MNHEPECFYKGKRDPEAEWYEPEDSPCICDQLQAAFQRGREAAARAVEMAESWYDEKEADPNGTVTSYIELDIAIAAARGDGEQA